MDTGNFFKENLFAVLKQGCGSSVMAPATISKYFVIGVMPAFRGGISLLHEAQLVSEDQKLHGICGFTEADIRTLIRHYLRKDGEILDQIADTMRRLYNGYYFASESEGELSTLYNPQLVFHYIHKFESCGTVRSPDEYSPLHSSHVLQHITGREGFSVDSLIKLMHDGFVHTKIIAGFGFSDLLTLGKEPKITWSFLLYLGILTRDQNNHGLRVPNLRLRFGVLERIVELLKVDKSIRHLITPAFNSLVEGDTKGLAELLRKSFQTRSIRSLIGERENGLRTVPSHPALLTFHCPLILKPHCHKCLSCFLSFQAPTIHNCNLKGAMYF